MRFSLLLKSSIEITEFNQSIYGRPFQHVTHPHESRSTTILQSCTFIFPAVKLFQRTPSLVEDRIQDRQAGGDDAEDRFETRQKRDYSVGTDRLVIVTLVEQVDRRCYLDSISCYGADTEIPRRLVWWLRHAKKRFRSTRGQSLRSAQPKYPSQHQLSTHRRLQAP